MKFCTNCGQQVAPQARFCEQCGTPAAAVPQPRAAQPAAQPIGAAAGPAGPPPLPASGGFAQPAAPAGPPAPPSPPPPPAEWVTDVAPQQRRTPRGLLTGVGVVAAVGVLGAVGYVAYDRLAGTSGGADDPTSAVLELSAAAGAEDPLTALSLLPPDEVGPVIDLYRDVEGKATSSGVASGDDPFAGFDLRLDGVQVQTEELGEDVAAVTVTGGTVSWAFDPTQVAAPLRIESDGDPRRPTSGTADLAEVTREAGDGAPVRIMTVQRDGRWYVSPTYTLLELWRVDQGLPAPDFSQPLELDGTGADSATAAVQGALQAVAGYDVDGLIDLLSPSEAGALYQYRDAITTALNRDGALAELRSEVQLSVSQVDATAGDEIDGHVPVTVRSVSGSVSADGDSYSWSLDRNCFSYSGDGDSGGDCLDAVTEDAGLGSDVAARFPQVTVLTSEEDGRWYLSPLATLVAAARDAVAEIPADDVLDVLGAPQFGSVTAPLTSGVSVDGSFTTSGDSALYEMQVPAGSVLDTCSDGDVSHEVYGPDGRPLGTGPVLATDGGAYRVLVTGYDEGSTYALTGLTSAVADLSVPGSVESGPGGCDERLARFQATAGTPLVVTTDSGLEAVVRDAGGATYPGGSFVPPATGEYFVTVPSASTLTVQAVPAGALVPGRTVDGTVGASGVARFQAFLTEGQSVLFEARGSGDLEPIVQLWSEDGQLLDRSYEYYSGSASLVYSPSSSGLYDVVVSGYGGSSGTFSLEVSEY